MWRQLHGSALKFNGRREQAPILRVFSHNFRKYSSLHTIHYSTFTALACYSQAKVETYTKQCMGYSSCYVKRVSVNGGPPAALPDYLARSMASDNCSSHVICLLLVCVCALITAFRVHVYVQARELPAKLHVTQLAPVENWSEVAREATRAHRFCCIVERSSSKLTKQVLKNLQRLGNPVFLYHRHNSLNKRLAR